MTMLELKPCTITEANKIVGRWHRHNRPTQGGLFAVSCEADGDIVGVGIVGRPNGRMAQDGYTCEILRIATNGHDNACSMLYGALCRAAKALGYRRVLTKTLLSEPGTSLRAAGFVLIGQTNDGETWARSKRDRIDVDLFGNELRPTEAKQRWIRYLTPGTQATLTDQTGTNERQLC